MGLTTTLNGHRATSARVDLPAWGAWHADVSLDGELSLTGDATLVLADLTLKGTILSGGPMKGRSTFRIVGGKGKWGKTIPKKSYANDLQVKVSTVLSDAASAAGETISVSTSDRTGPAFVRPEGPACRVLEQLAPSAWYIDESGVTKLGARPSVTFTGKATRINPVDLARATLQLAPESIAQLLPGVVVDGLEAIDVCHTISAEAGLRTVLYGKRGAAASRSLAALRDIVDQLDPDRRFRGTWEYRVVTQEGERLNLQPVRVSTGMPDIGRAYVRPGVPGARADVALGSRVLVTFVDCDPGRPVVVGFEDAEGEGFIPTKLELCGGSDYVALAAKVGTELTTLKNAISSAVVVPTDGGASLKATILAALTTWPNSTAAAKVKAT